MLGTALRHSSTAISTNPTHFIMLIYVLSFTKPTHARRYVGASKCLNDGKAGSWISTFYASQSTCCATNFSWDYYGCMGTSPPPSNKWYIDWGMGKCVQDCNKSQGGSCGGLAPGAWIVMHSTAEACCTTHLSYVSFSQCKYTG